MWALTVNGRICEGKRNQGETQEVGDPGGASRKRATTFVIARFICLFVLALTTQANTVAGAKTRPHDDAEGPSTARRARLRCEGLADPVEGPSMMQTTHRGCGGPLDSAEDLSAQWRTPRLSG